MATAERPSRSRRSSEDVRALLLETARELFLEHGYEETTTKEICKRAGVAEPLLFTNFGSKEGLFEAAVLAPIGEFVAEYASSLQDSGEGADPEERVDRFVRGVFSLARQNRTVLLTAISQRLHRSESAEDDVLDQLAATLQGVHGVTDLHDYPDVDPEAATAAVTAMVLGAALLDDLLFPAGSRRPSQDRLTAEIKKLVLHGTTKRG